MTKIATAACGLVSRIDRFIRRCRPMGRRARSPIASPACADVELLERRVLLAVDVVFHVDESRSSITFSAAANITNGDCAFTPQNPSGDIARYGGTLQVEIDNLTAPRQIRLASAMIQAISSGEFQPAIGGTTDLPRGPANHGLQCHGQVTVPFLGTEDVNGFVATRGENFSLTSGALSVDEKGHFASDQLTAGFNAGVADVFFGIPFRSGGASLPLSAIGTFPNTGSRTATVTRGDDGRWELAIPFSVELPFQTTVGGITVGASLTAVGEIIGHLQSPPGISVSTTDGPTSVSESGDTDSVSVVLDAEPQSAVIVNVISGDAGEVTVSPDSMTFTTANWNVPQSVTLTGVADGRIDGDQTSEITISVNSGESDPAFTNVTDQTVRVTTVDIDPVDGLDTDGNGVAGALSDGILILRHLAQFRGSTLVDNVVDTVGGLRKSETAIADYLRNIEPVLDIDGNGTLDALSDGILVVRFMAGFRDQSLIGGVVDTDRGTRITATAIAEYLDQYMRPTFATNFAVDDSHITTPQQSTAAAFMLPDRGQAAIVGRLPTMVYQPLSRKRPSLSDFDEHPV